MSRIGKNEITIPDGVEVSVETKDLTGKKVQVVKVKGPKGELSREFRPEIQITKEDKLVKVSISGSDRLSRSLWGLSRTLIQNMILGVTTGFRKDLELVGVGYRVVMKGQSLDFQIGKSHPTVIEPPAGITFAVEKGGTKFSVEGADKEVVGQVSANIRDLRPPEPYKGKGIKYAGEYIRRKAGKSGAKAA